MTHERATPDRDERTLDPALDPALDRALASLPMPAIDPLWSRATRLAAERRLQNARPLSLSARYEPLLLITLSALQLIWAALRVFASVR